MKKDAARAKAAADPFATPGSARATLTAHRNKVKTDKSKKSKEYKEAKAAWFHGTNAHYRNTTIEGRGVGKVGAVFTVGMNRTDIDGVRDDEGNKYKFTTKNGSYSKPTALWQTDGSDGVGSKVELDRYADFVTVIRPIPGVAPGTKPRRVKLEEAVPHAPLYARERFRKDFVKAKVDARLDDETGGRLSHHPADYDDVGYRFPQNKLARCDSTASRDSAADVDATRPALTVISPIGRGRGAVQPAWMTNRRPTAADFMKDVDQPSLSKKWPDEATTRVSGGLEDFFRKGGDLKCVEGPENPEHEGARPLEDANVKRSLEAGTTGPATKFPAGL